VHHHSFSVVYGSSFAARWIVRKSHGRVSEIMDVRGLYDSDDSSSEFEWERLQGAGKIKRDLTAYKWPNHTIMV
jgi:hypothetical protein